MNLSKKIVLLAAAISLTRVLITTVGLFVSIIPLGLELSPGEESLRTAYEIIGIYSLVITILLIVLGVSIYREAINKKPLKLNLALALILFFICGVHLIFAVVGNPNAYLVQSAQSFLWVPMLISFAALVSVLTSRLKIFQRT